MKGFASNKTAVYLSILIHYKEFKTTVIIITHDEEAAACCDRTVYLTKH